MASEKKKDALHMVAEFMTAMEQPVSQGFEDKQGMLLGMALILEEAKELQDEVQLMIAGKGEAKDFVKELADLEYVVNWMAAKIGIDLPAATAAVHDSNMSKLGEDGKPIKREDGKVLKGPNYHKPDMTPFITPITLG